MDKSIKFLCLILIVFLTVSCNGQDFETELIVHNKTGKILDSIKVHTLLDKELTYVNVKPDSIINVKCKDFYSKLPRGERGVFSINVFNGGYFYERTAGFIGFPGTRLENKYELYIYPDYIATDSDDKPYKAEKKKTSEYISGN